MVIQSLRHLCPSCSSHTPTPTPPFVFFLCQHVGDFSPTLPLFSLAFSPSLSPRHDSIDFTG